MPPQIDIVNITSELFLKTAKEWANELKDNNSTSQMRKFYNEVCSLEDRLSACPSNQEKQQQFMKLQPSLCMLVPKAVYAKTRKHADEKFVEMITSAIKQVNDPDTLAHFRMFFEAVIGFSPKK